LYKNATRTLLEIKNTFDELTASCDPELVATWEKESVLPRKNRNGEWESVYCLKAEWDKGEKLM
jgi:hypothetical protein